MAVERIFATIPIIAPIITSETTCPAMLSAFAGIAGVPVITGIMAMVIAIESTKRTLGGT